MGIFPNKYIASLDNLDCHVFDHGTGTGWIHLPTRNLDELAYLKKIYIHGLKSKDILKKKNIDITYIKSSQKFFYKKKNVPRKVLYISPHEKSNFAFSPLLIDDVIAYKIRYQLISKLKKKYLCFYKPHPASNVKIVKNFLKQVNIQLENRKFEDIFLDYDLLFFDNIATTCTKTAFASNQPILFLNYLGIYLNKKVIHDLNKRVSMIDIKNYKFSLSEELLSALIKDSIKKRNDKSFFKKYF